MIRLLQKLALLLPALFLFPSSGQTADPVLARLYFKVPPDRMAEFEAVYHTKIAPFLKKYGLVASSRTGRLTPENIFSQLFELKSAAEIDAKKQALTQDTAWRRLGRELRQTHGAIFRNFGPYIVPAGPGKTVLAGPGTQISMGSGKGIWQTFDETDGLADGPVGTIFQDRDGYLWVGTSGGASRYDGHTWTTFTQKDGLGHDWVRGIGQDDVGNMWFGTSNGISRFNGKTWKTFNEADGLPSQYLWEVMKDRKDNMWFGMNGGISRYDGHRFTHWGLDAGINSRILGILQDRNGDMWFVGVCQ